jgi:hypothetical protein
MLHGEHAGLINEESRHKCGLRVNCNGITSRSPALFFSAPPPFFFLQLDREAFHSVRGHNAIRGGSSTESLGNLVHMSAYDIIF